MKKFQNLRLIIRTSLMIVLSVSFRSFADDPSPLPEQNTMERHIDCTSLSDQAKAYYNGNYAYDKLSALKGASDTASGYTAMQDNELYEALHTLMDETQTFFPTYSGYNAGALAYYWNRTDAVKDSLDFIGFYSDIVYDYPSQTGKKFNMEREHIWPKSRASYNKQFGGSDLHHLRPSVSEINQAKSDHEFGNVQGLYPVGSEDVIFKDTVYAWVNDGKDIFECKDDVKGDVARILLYIYCRWEQPNLYTRTATAQLPGFDPDDTTNTGMPAIESLDTLLEWIEDDPVDTWEMERNDLVQQVQGNRNVFIDYPELAWLLFGKEVPEKLQSPSHSGCHHEYEIQTKKSSTCVEEGSLTKVCKKCGNAEEFVIDYSDHTDADQDHLCDNCGKYVAYPSLFRLSDNVDTADHIVIVSKESSCAPKKEARPKADTI